MGTESEQQTTPTTQNQQYTVWYHAATLTERLASWSGTEAARVLEETGRKEEAEKIVQRWKAQKPFDSGTFFAERLGMDNITEQDLPALLAEPVEALAKRLSSPVVPDWVAELIYALSASTPLPVLDQDRERFAQQFALVQPLYPLLQTSIACLQAGIATLAQQYDPPPFDPQTLLSLLLPGLFQQIEQQVSKTLVLELNVARLRGLLSGETPQERFQHYLRQLSQPEQLRSLLEEYSVLARQVLLCAQLWAECSLEFVQRLCIDWQEILSVFQPPSDPGKLTEVRDGAGDTHRGGHSVMLLTFGSGWQLVYKPKSLQVDVHFQELLTWLNARGSHPAFRPLMIIDRGTYGWSEYVTASSCSNEAEVARFYERQGGYLALLYMLEATDFHHENVIAAGEHPILVDLEALFQPRQNFQGSMTPGLAQQILDNSVTRSLLLPTPVFLNKEGEGIDISGLGQAAGQLTPSPVPQWEDAGTDEMKLVRRRIALQGSHNCPLLHDQEVQPLDYLEYIINGFTIIYRLLLVYRNDLLATWLPRFAHDEIRFVARSTSTYSRLLTESFHPNMLRNALKRERFLDHLWIAVASQASLARLIPAERADLLRGDIPLFTSYPESRNVWTSRRECLPNFFEQSSLELVRQRVQWLSEEDLQRQSWIIRTAFVQLASQRMIATPAVKIDLSHRTSLPVNRKFLLSQACAIGDRLDTLALRDKERADWLGLTLLFERTWQIAAAGLDLQSGLPGIILFLGYLGSISGDARYTDLAQAGLKTLRTMLHQREAFLDQAGIGAFTGLSSCLYLFTHLAVLWNDSSFLKEAEELAPKLACQIVKDEQFDLMDGAAGSMAILLNLNALAPSAQILQLARACGDHLLAYAQPMAEGLGWRGRGQDIPLSGFSHGVAGIAWSLLKLAAVSGEERFHQAAEAALIYERSLFSPEQRNWRDMRTQLRRTMIPDSQETELAQARFGLSWSHGAPGIALGRLLSLPYLDHATIRCELDAALSTTITEGFGYAHELVGPNHSLAHGDCGNLETVLLATQILHAQLHTHLERLTVRVGETMQQQGWITGVPLNLDTPGLMFGLAGIGYQCLRLAEPEKVPSVLTLAPPLTSPETL